MVTGLAFAATAIAGLFAEAVLVRYTRSRRLQHLAWSVALAMFTVASAALAAGTSTGFDRATFRLFYLFGAVLDVPWLALGVVHLLASPRAARRAQWALVFFSGLAVGVLLSAPMAPVSGTQIPVGKDVFGAFPRALAAIGSGVSASVIVAAALWSVVRLRAAVAEQRRPGAVAANVLVALGTLVLSSGGIVQGAVGHDEAFAMTLTLGIAVVYLGFRVGESRPA